MTTTRELKVGLYDVSFIIDEFEVEILRAEKEGIDCYGSMSYEEQVQLFEDLVELL